MELTDEQWDFINKHLPKPKVRSDGKGRPRQDPRAVLNGILWILKTGSQWSELPRDKYPPHTTVHRYFQQWSNSGVLEKVLRALAEDLRKRGKINMKECFIDGSFIGAKKGATALARPSVAKAQSSWPLQTLLVFLSPCTQKVLNLRK